MAFTPLGMLGEVSADPLSAFGNSQTGCLRLGGGAVERESVWRVLGCAEKEVRING